MKLSPDKDQTGRWTLPVIERYVRRLLHDSDAQYRDWLEHNDPGRLALRKEAPDA